MSLKQRVMLITAVAVVVAATVVGLFAYTLVSRQLLSTIDETLLVSAAEARISDENLTGQPLPSDIPNSVAIARLNRVTGAVELVRAAGSSDSPKAFPDLNADQLATAANGPVSIDTPEPYRVYVRVMDPKRGTAIAVVSLKEYQRALNNFAWRLTAALLVVLITVILLTWFIARRMFRPLDHIVRSAERITSGDSSTRVPALGSATEVHQLADSLNAMISRLAASEAALRGFISDTSHEIRTPLTVISGYVQKVQLQVEAGQPVDRDALGRISREVDRLERLVTQLLRLDKLDKLGKREKQFVSVRLDGVMREELADLESLHPDRSVLLHLEPLSIEGDEDALRQAFANIRQNLERYTPAEAIVEANLTLAGSDAVVTIDDSGPGIPDPERRASLTSLNRGPSPRDAGTAGFGLGMVIIATVVANHGGSLSLEESPLGGLRTRITLPLHARSSD